jgi:hypothetical protein
LRKKEVGRDGENVVCYLYISSTTKSFIEPPNPAYGCIIKTPVLGKPGFVVVQSSTSSSDEFVWTSINDDMINLVALLRDNANWVFFGKCLNVDSK